VSKAPDVMTSAKSLQETLERIAKLGKPTKHTHPEYVVLTNQAIDLASRGLRTTTEFLSAIAKSWTVK